MAFKRLFFISIVAGLLLAGCQPGPTTTPTPGVPNPSASTPTPPTPALTPVATKPAARTLTICLGQEPRSLYVYGGSSRGMWSVLEAVYDGPFDTRKFSAQPVILQKLPSLPDSDASLTPVEVKAGDIIADANGDLVAMAAGVKVLPSGCSGTGCAAAWDGKKTLKLDQLKVTFRLLPGLKWSDGQSLTAGDSVYSYQLATDPATPVSRRIADRTVSYRAVDETTVEWVGLPGFVPARLDTLFWQPLPQHAWGKLKAADLQTTEESTRRPLGWGPYVIQEWQTGKFIRLQKNPNYFRAAEGLPKFDTLVYRFLGEQGDNNLAALQNGTCDLVDQTALLDDQLETLVNLSNSKQISLYAGLGPEWDLLAFGVRPASYDNGYKPSEGDRPDFFGDVRVRQAVAYCLDRKQMIQELWFNRSAVPGGYLPPTHPLFDQSLAPLAYDPAQGARLLDEAGWKDTDGNPTTPRQYQGGGTIPKGTPFSITYLTSEAPLRKKAASIAADNLAKCGIQASIQALNPGGLYAPGPDGPLFGRKFDLAQFAWEAGSQPACFLFEGNQTPDAKNSWLGVNISGLASQAYDAACAAARQARPESTDYAGLQKAAQKMFVQELPALPLYFQPKLAIGRPDFCGLEMDVTARSVLWGLEGFDTGACSK